MAKILIVDDDSVSRVLIRHIATSNGHDVTEVVDGQKALDELENLEFDMIICDYEMPGMTGLELLEQIRITMNIPFILVTGYLDQDDLPNSELKPDGYISKPVSSDQLINEITELLS